jgi:Tfp pilus assembly protein PilX
MKLPNNKLKNDQRGIASFLISIFMMLVVTLIVLGFSQIARREQRVALDRELSTQAFYAAESGVNDAIDAIQGVLDKNNNSTVTVSPQDKTDCGTNPPGATDIANGYGSLTGQVNTGAGATGISYTCLLIGTVPNSLVYSGTTSKVINVQTAGSTAIGSINLNWQTNSGADLFSMCPSLGSFPAKLNVDCSADVLQVDLLPGTALAAPNAQSPQANPESAMEAQEFTVFFFPQSGVGNSTITYDVVNNQGKVVAGSCNTATGCSAQINGLNETQYYMRVTAMYGIAQNITVTGSDVNGAPINFENGQAVIDSTGKDQDVLRRVQVRTTLNTLNNNLFPNYAIQSTQTICKRFYITPAGTAADSGNNPYPGAPDLTLSTDPADCSLDVTP